MRRLLELFDQQVPHMPPSNAEGRIRGLAAAYCNDAMLRQAVLLDQKDTPRDWGSFIEYLLYDASSGSWSKGPRRLHLVFRTDLESGRLVAGLVPTALAYEPSVNGGRILGVYARNNKYLAKDYILDDLLVENEHVFNKDETILFWANWQPDVATLTFLPPEELSSKSPLIKSTEYHQERLLTFSFGSHFMHVEVDDKIISSMLKEISIKWNI